MSKIFPRFELLTTRQLRAIHDQSEYFSIGLGVECNTNLDRKRGGFADTKVLWFLSPSFNFKKCNITTHFLGVIWKNGKYISLLNTLRSPLTFPSCLQFWKKFAHKQINSLTSKLRSLQANACNNFEVTEEVKMNKFKTIKIVHFEGTLLIQYLYNLLQIQQGFCFLTWCKSYAFRGTTGIFTEQQIKGCWIPAA